MKFRCERDTLAEAVATAQRTVASRSGVFRCSRTSASVRPVTASSSWARTSRSRTGCRCRPRSRRRASPSSKLIGEIVRRLEPGPVTVVVTGDEAVITAGRFTTSLRLKPAEDYPRFAVHRGRGRHGRRGRVRGGPAAGRAGRLEGRSAADPHGRVAHRARRTAARCHRLVPARGQGPQGREHAAGGPTRPGRGEGPRRGAAARRRR